MRNTLFGVLVIKLLNKSRWSVRSARGGFIRIV